MATVGNMKLWPMENTNKQKGTEIIKEEGTMDKNLYSTDYVLAKYSTFS